MFAYGALSRSGKLIQESVSDKNPEIIKEFTTSVISLAAKKRYLQEPAVLVILQLIEKVPNNLKDGTSLYAFMNITRIVDNRGYASM